MTLNKLNKVLVEKPKKKIKSLWKSLGPGVITGASDDDPSGIAAYSQAGAMYGLATLWSAVYTFPMMAAIQEMCARIGIVTKRGLVGNIKKYYSKWILYVVLLFAFPAITINIGADIAGMGAVSNLLIPKIPAIVFSTIFSIILIYCVINFPYNKLANILKWLCLTLLVYILVPFIVGVNWKDVLIAGFIPDIQFNKMYLAAIVGILGTTISPYLFFWQTSMSLEDRNHKKHSIIVGKKELSEVRSDVVNGMFFSNVVAFFIILTTGTVLFSAGVNDIQTVEQAAMALKPLAGNLAYLLFAIGVIGTGFLAIPVLAGGLSYGLSEIFGWKEGMDRKWHQAKGFYSVMTVSILIGLLINFLNISPIHALIWTAIIYGLIAPVVIVVILDICNDKRIMGKYTNGKISNILGFITLAIMSSTALALIYFYL